MDQRVTELSPPTTTTTMSTIVDTCEREVRRWILTGTLRPGDRLPPERALAAQLGVNRTTLRSALTRLATARLVQVRQGSGYVVQDFRRAGGLELLADVCGGAHERCEIVMGDLLSVRRSLLRSALLDLVDRATEAAELSRALNEKLAASLTDSEVVSLVVGAARTPVFALSFNPVALAIRAQAALCESLDREAPGLAIALTQWLERPARDSLEAMLDEIALRDRRVVEDAAVRLSATRSPAAGSA
jgi:hypothetical protein